MPAKSYKNTRNITIILLLVLLPSLCTYAEKENIKKEARYYRDKGYEAQTGGDLDTAMSYYQKAVEADPFYAGAYNDLGVIYEIKGFKQRALESYLRCLSIDPYYLSVYFNLACFYEASGDLGKAAEFWKKRIKLGDPNDPWTKKAKKRLQNIAQVVEEIALELKQKEAVDLSDSLSIERGLSQEGMFEDRSQRKRRAEALFTKAKQCYWQGDYAAALKNAATAQYLDPSNSEIEEFLEKIRGKLGSYAR